MAIRVALNHVSHYKFDRPVTIFPHLVRLRPAPHARTPILAYSLKVAPASHFLNWQQDPYSNYMARLVFPEKASELKIEVDLVAEMTVINPFDFFVEPSAATFPFVYETVLKRELAPYLEARPHGQLLDRLLREVRRADAPTIDYLVEINQAVHKAIRYNIRMEAGVQTPEETLGCASGSCRDFAWLLVNLLRHLGLAARFVSGYLIQLVADVKSLDGPSGATVDFTDLHAWAEVYIPGAGWIGLDATSGLMTGEGHIPLACTAEPISAAPITGSTDKCEATFHPSMSVRRIHEDPRVTKPYTEEQWKRIEALGHLVDDRLNAADVRLTMGGEPTFVSIDDMDGEEWTTAALGEHKRERAEELMKRLRRRFAIPEGGGLLHYGQGKWYPGEPLPRWSLACYWRKDGVPVWKNEALTAEEGKPLGHSSETAQRFATTLAKKLDSPEARVSAEHVISGYEDTWYHHWKERRLPTNVDPMNNNLAEKEEGARLSKLFERGVEKVVGCALPLRPIGAAGSGLWQSGSWFFRTERMFLVPGDSPMGFRLPLDSLPWAAPGDIPIVQPVDPLEQIGELPTMTPRQPRIVKAGTSTRPLDGEQQLGEDAEDPNQMPAHGESAGWVVRTALCVEPRNGILHLFMPPVRYVADYLELVARIEETAAELGTPIIVEGYTPPSDRRVEVLKVTPDPGVIEVNVQPAKLWDDAVAITEGLYEDAHYSRLATEKFMLDGRHTGTGGGNHIVIGGPSPADSPFLRRPDLLKSLVGYWHNHPSLTYLFSGMFVGPTSQAPRADEGRPDGTYELEIALRQVPSAAELSAATPPWLVDRLFRHLLVDLTGNTHRAELSIDKLYSPDSATGRLGLVEFRGFEMPPHARMSLTQQLLLRSLLARFWERPYEEKLVRWATELHDRFMLPHFIGADFTDVLTDTAAAGFALERAWFAPHFEFRFPVMGELTAVAAGGMHLELRQAMEPWYVLGEEPAGGGTARYVDSSVERLQVKLSNAINTRHTLAVNGVAIPLQPTGVNGEFVAGVRYRAWQPPSCLHPTIGVHSPLVFDVVDRWNSKSVAGCTYHVASPGGRSYDDFPVNAFSAEARRAGRFFKFGHTAGPITVREPERSLEFPLTLDLRRL